MQAGRRSLASFGAVSALLLVFGWMQHSVFLSRSSSSLDYHVYEKLTVLEEAVMIGKSHIQELQHLVEESLRESIQFHPLKQSVGELEHDRYYFMSRVPGRGPHVQGAPELLEFPSNSSSGRLLCFRGNSTKDGSRNFYALVYPRALPQDAVFLPGTTLVSDSHFDFSNPWHSMYNLVQFVQWKLDNGCSSADRLVLFHLGEIRGGLGSWIRSVFESNNLTTNVDSMEYQGRPVCFERAVVSRSGIGSVPAEFLQKLFAEVRCQARKWCQQQQQIIPHHEKSSEIHVTLIVREGDRRFVNSTEWENVVELVCRKFAAYGCRWSKVLVSRLDFCQQVELMSTTNILVSVHGAQLTNMIFMSPGSRILEMFPKGWLELAGHGQFIYMHLANWVGLRHEGYWRDDDPSTQLK